MYIYTVIIYMNPEKCSGVDGCTRICRFSDRHFDRRLQCRSLSLSISFSIAACLSLSISFSVYEITTVPFLSIYDSTLLFSNRMLF